MEAVVPVESDAAIKYHHHNGALKSPLRRSSPSHRSCCRGSGLCSEDSNDSSSGSLSIVKKSSNQTSENFSDDCEILTSDSHPSAYEKQGQGVISDKEEKRFLAATTEISWLANGRQKIVLCRHFRDSGLVRNFSSLPLFFYTSSTNSTSSESPIADGSVYRQVANAINESFDLERTRNSGMDCMPLASSSHHHQTADGTVAYQQHHPYSNYHLHHSNHHHIQPEQTKSLQELQNEVGALLEFRDLVIETFPDLKHKMASISAAASTSVSGNNTLTGLMSNSSLASRREWEPGIRIKRKISQKEPSTSAAGNVNISTATVTAATTSPSSQSVSTVPAISGELLSSSLTRSRSNSHSGKKEPKSGENNGSVVQDSGFSTETSSSKEAHSASSTTGAMAGAITSNRLTFLESDNELLNLLDVIHRKSNRLRDEVDHLQNYERNKLQETDSDAADGERNNKTNDSCLTPKTFRDHVERLNKEDIQQLRKERDKLLDKLAEMEAETLTGRIKATKMNDQVEELINVKKDLEEQLKIALSQKLELNSKLLELSKQQQQQQQQLLQSKSSSSQSDYSSQRTVISSPNTNVSAGNIPSENHTITVPIATGNLRLTTASVSQKLQYQQNTFQPVVIESSSDNASDITNRKNLALSYESSNIDASNSEPHVRDQDHTAILGRLDGVVSNPGGRLSKVRVIDPKKIAAILLETSVIELQRHLLTLTVQNQVLSQKLEQVTKSKIFLGKKFDKSKEDVDDLRFQLEEKDIELEGTKAQLRVLEARVSSATSSYAPSHQEHEANRSASTTLVTLTRQEASSSAIPPPPLQISTPSMKAMTHLPIDDMQHHSSSTESAHDHEHEQSTNIREQQQQQRYIISGMSTSVGSTSPFETLKRSSKPSKIPLPGTKNYFAPKPPSGRSSFSSQNKSHSTSSPPTANLSNTSTTSSTASNKSLSRSTGNLFGKSSNSLKRTDSAQSIRKDNSSLSTNASRSSSSSIPISSGLLTTKSSPSPYKILANSPLPKLKRDSLTSRVRHLDSLSRVHHLNTSTPTSATPSKSPSNQLNSSPYGYHHHTNSSTSPSSSSSSFMGVGGGTSGSTVNSSSTNSAPTTTGRGISSTSTMRKDFSSNSFSQGQFLRKQSATMNSSSTVSTTRRFSSASIGRGQRNSHDMVISSIGSGGGLGGGSGGGSFNTNNISAATTTPAASPSAATIDQQQHNDTDSGKNLKTKSSINNFRPESQFKSPLICEQRHQQQQHGYSPKLSGMQFKSKRKIEPLKLNSFLNPVNEEDDNCNCNCDDKNHLSGNLLVTFDYGFIDNPAEIISEVNMIRKSPNSWLNSIRGEQMTFSIRDSDENFEQNCFYQPHVLENKSNFTVHKMQHDVVIGGDGGDGDGGSGDEDFYDSIG